MSDRITKGKMVTTNITVKIVDSPEKAPMYGDNYKPLKAETCIVVGNGTESGKPTVDIQLIDEEGERYLVMATGSILEQVGEIIGARRKTDEMAWENVH